MQGQTIIEEWPDVALPAVPELRTITVDPERSALLVLDIQKGNCSAQTRPRCEATVPRIARLLSKARSRGMCVIFSLTRGAEPADIRFEVAPLTGEPVIKAGVDKFLGTPLGDLLSQANVEAVIVTGTSAHGAVLHTATGAALRGLRVCVPVDCMSAAEPFAELYTAWHMLNAPGTRQRALLTRSDMIQFTE